MFDSRLLNRIKNLLQKKFEASPSLGVKLTEKRPTAVVARGNGIDLVGVP